MTISVHATTDHQFRGLATVRQEGDRFVVDYDYGAANYSYWETYEEARAEAARLFSSGNVSELKDFIAKRQDDEVAQELEDAERAYEEAGFPLVVVAA